jgi:hypothetical protein
MLKVMDMTTGKIIEDEFGSFEDEVLDAGWLPPVPELQLGLSEVRHEVRADSEFDAEAFLSKVYRNQA